MGIILGIVIILLLTFGMVSIIRGILPRTSDSNTRVSQSEGTAYPPPGETNTPPAPTLARTDVFPWDLPTRTPYPITPAPTLTLVPGPSPTPLPLIQPARDASGKIYYFTGEDDKSQSTIYAIDVDSGGKMNPSPAVVSIEDSLNDQTIFPSPDGALVAIVGPWGTVSIYNVEKGEFENTTLPPASGEGKFYSWFPDSRRILNGAGSLILKDPFTTNRTYLAMPGYGQVIAAAASPDGRYVVYSFDTDILYPKGLWIVNTNGQDAHLLVEDIEPYNISWSPDLKRIAFFSGNWQVVNADGSDLRELAKGVFLPQCYFLPALWSPDSSTLAVVTSKSGQAFCNGWSENLFKDTNIVLIDVASGEARPLLSDGSLGNIDPVWSPDGSKLAFVTNRNGSPEIWVVNKDGTDLQQLTQNDRFERYPFWRPVNESNFGKKRDD
ncbi:PD40 domain-containing protein [Longilinea arvoryzae]|uniref:PD40 domain-containing protein n=1 Tax=Longilinea arvoryzae TaxID=360412 RepID=UPI00155FC62E|nr:PD40 domain-containing protein [Longilinea arvoryzae]